MLSSAQQRPVRTIPTLFVDALRTVVPTGRSSLKALRAFGENFDPDAFLELRRVSREPFDNYSRGCRYQYRYPNGDGLELVRRVDIGSVVRVDLNHKLLRKESQFAQYAYGCSERDADWLHRIDDSVSPHLFEYNDGLIVMSYEGEPVNMYNLPADWREQAELILAALAAANCAHNDIRRDNLVVAEGRLRIIDFGFATEIGAPIPSDWPERLGEDHRIDVHRFDDRKAIFEALSRVEQKASGHRPLA